MPWSLPPPTSRGTSWRCSGSLPRDHSLADQFVGNNTIALDGIKEPRITGRRVYIDKEPNLTDPLFDIVKSALGLGTRYGPAADALCRPTVGPGGVINMRHNQPRGLPLFCWEIAMPFSGAKLIATTTLLIAWTLRSC
jgi:hypothetical protein